MAAQNEPNFALFRAKLENFSMSSFSLFPFCVVYVFRARIMCVLCNRYDARWISKTKSQNTRKWRNGGIKNPLFDALTYNTSGHFAHCWYFF